MSGVLVVHGVPVGRLVQEVVVITLVNNTGLTTDIVVPAGKRWLVQSIKVLNPDDVGRATSIDFYKEAAATNRIKRLALADVAAVGELLWPNNTLDDVDDADPRGHAWPLLVTEGNLIRIVQAAGGASAGGASVQGLVYQHLEIDI